MTRWILLILACAVVVALGVAVGPAALTPTDVWDALWGVGDEATVAIVRELRVPRVVLAFLVGGCLAATGAALQALVRNPLADPYLLGLSGGAGLGAVAAIALGIGGVWSVPLAALAGALLAIALVYRVALVAGAVLDTRVLLLGGVVVGAFAASIMGAIMALSPAPEVRNALMWLLGSFERSSWRSVAIFATYAVLPLGVLFAYARDLDLLSLGEEPAHYLGSNVERSKRVLYLTAS
ncbi:MAG: iron ABC transporter permease, partial [Gemmatimonadota bacterium]|nr:iron ABC transporter permease [Gemmatimonadota bacterium]